MELRRSRPQHGAPQFRLGPSLNLREGPGLSSELKRQWLVTNLNYKYSAVQQRSREPQV